MNNTEQLNRMKALMNYGLKTENKQSYSSVEYTKVGADGKLYGIVREGTKFYIKTCNDSKNPIKENFDYIGGFCNRKNNEYASYANALKQFDLKMMGLKEQYGNGKQIVIESWNPSKNEELSVESTEKMRTEIMRQRQIMENSRLIREGKSGECKKDAPFCCDVDKEFKVGDGNKSECNPKMEKNDSKETCAEVNESSEPLAWHETGGDTKKNMADTYLDTSHGTEIGDTAPFDEKPKTNGSESSDGVVEEGESMHDTDNQNSPAPGTGEVGDDAPFDEKAKNINEDLSDVTANEPLNDAYDAEYDVNEDDEDTPIDSEESFENSLDTFDDLSDGEGDEEEITTDTEIEEPTEDGGDVSSRLDSLEDMMRTILDKLDSMSDESYEDEPLYGDDSADSEDADAEAVDGGDEDFSEPTDEFPSADDDEVEEIYESRAYRALKKRMNEENKLDVFGKHPAYQKKVMELPKTGEDKNEHGEDWNDESVYSEKPYGEEIGSSEPFEVDPKELENSIAEAVKKILGSRKKL